MSKSRAKGTYAETALTRWFQTNGFPHADRQPPRGNRDQGDINLCPGIVIEVKNYNGTAGLGQPPAATLTKWMTETVRERDNAGAAYCPLIVKRAGTTDPGRWFAYITINDLLNIVSQPNAIRIADETYPGSDPACLTVASLTTLLRHAGYGTTPEETTP